MRWRISVLTLSLVAACLLLEQTSSNLKAQEPQKANEPANPLQDLFQKLMPATPPAVAPPAANPLQKLFQQLMPYPTPAAGPPVPNPLQNLFQKLMPRQAVPRPVLPLGAVPRAANGQPLDPDARDQIDGRAAKDRKQAEVLRKANAAVEAQDWTTALELLQNLLAQEEDSVERIGREWHSVRERAMRLMLKLPEKDLRSFRFRVGAEAARRLDEAERSGRIDRLAHVAMRFLLLEPGQTAAQRLAMRHLDRGEFTQATRWFRWLEDAKAAVTNERPWQLQAALAAKQAGNKELAEKWLKGNRPEIEDGPASRPPQADDEHLEMGGTRIRVSDWFAAIPARVVSQTSLAEWPMFFGAPNRAALSRGGEPLLLPRWRQPLTQVQPLQQQLEMLIEDMHDQNRSTISVCQPLLVNGLVVMRTLGGVQVIDLETGRPLWSTAERFKAEDLIGPGNAPQTYVQVNRGIRIFNGVRRYEFSNMAWEQHPLAQLLFANGNFGVLSSDGRQLFSVEDDTFVMQQFQNYYGGNQDLSRQDPLRRSWTSNKLVSYDLRNGRPLWAVGGVESDEPFQPELPGVFFFGAPVPDGHELFVIGERDAEIRLFCLQADSGKLLWSQLLATAEAAISRDAARRQFAAQVAIADGVVICPTTVGWLAAVDRASRQLLWVHRYSTPQAAVNNQRRVFGQSMTQAMPWGQRWLPSAPVIVGDAVVYTPQETFNEQDASTSNIVCLGLHNGTRRWTKPKQTQNWLALNGVADGKVLLLGQTSISALNLSNGETAWTEAIPNGDGVPSGLGTIANDRWHVPLSSGQIWTMSLKNGSRTGRQWAGPGARLGNLSLYRGSMVSAHPAGLTCFEQREAVVEQIRQRKARDPADVLALLTEASILQLEHKSSDAWGVLQRVPAESVSAELRPRYLAALRDVLTEVIQQKPVDHAVELAIFEKWLTTPDDQLQAMRLRVEHLRGRGEHVAAFELLLELARKNGDAVLLLSGSPPLSIRSEAWVGGQLADLWNALPADGRGDLDRRLADEVRNLSAATSAARQRGLELFGFHPATRELRWQDIEAAITERDVSRAELALLRLSESTDARESARAWRRLLELYRSLGLPNDAAAAGQQLARLGDLPLGEGMTAKQWVEQEINAERLGKTIASNGADWSKLDFKLERSVGYQGNTEQVQECSLTDATWPFFTAQRFQYQMLNSPVATQRLSMSRLSDSQLDWSLPLRFKSTSTLGASTMIRTVGHQMLVYHREVLHLLSPVDHRVLWTRSTESRGANNFDPTQVARRQTLPMQPGASFLSQPIDANEDVARNALLPLCTPEFIAYRGRRTLTMLDAATGQWRWELRDLPNDTRVQATHDLMFLTSTRWPSGLLLRTQDGRALPFEGNVREKFQLAKTALGNDLLVVSRGQADLLSIERWNPQTRQAVWRETFPISIQFGWLDNHTLATLGQDGKLATFDLDTHESQTLGMLQPADLSGLNLQKYLVSDNDRLFLIVSGQQTNFYGDELVTVPVNGTIFAFDRRAGGELWRQKVDNQALVLNHFGASPALLFSTRKFEQRGRVHVQVHRLLMFDKKTGRKLFEDELTNQFNGFRLNLNLAERYIELLTYNDRLRLVGSEPSPK